MKIGKAIKDCRTRAGMSQTKLAKLSKVSQGYLTNVENNNLMPSQKIIQRISDALKIPPIALLVMATDAKDIKKSKKKLYGQLKPVLDGLVEIILTETYGEPK